MSTSTVYIDEAGDLGVRRGTRWFVLSAVIVKKSDEKDIRNKLAAIKSRLNVGTLHLRKITDFNKRAFIVRGINEENFCYINIIADTNKFDTSKIPSPTTAYNYLCRMLIERVSWYLRDTEQTADIILSARGTSRDGELIHYIKEKLIPYSQNQISKNVIEKITAKPAGSWDLLQLADVCATTMFLAHEKNGWGFIVPCYVKALNHHIYRYNGRLASYGIKHFMPEMTPNHSELKSNWICIKKERTPGATTT